MKSLHINIDKEYSFDTVVVGGGTTGVFAALAAARKGTKTALVEENGFLGGTAATGLPWMAFHNFDQKRRIIGGIPFEVIERLRKIDGASEFLLDPILESTVYVDPNLLRIVFFQMIEEANITLFLHSICTEVDVERSTVKGIYIHNRGGCQYINAKVVIDTTDCCCVAYNAGVPIKRGRDGDGKTQVSSTVFTIGNVNVDEMIDYFRQNPTQLRPHLLPKNELEYVINSLKTAPLFSLGAFRELITKATSDGLNFPRETMIGIVHPSQNEIMLVTPRIENVNPLDEVNFSESEIKGYAQISEIMKFVNKYMPGGKNARIINIGHTIGMRETSHIVGEYTMSSKDILEGTIHSDTIAIGSYYMDLHSPDNKGLAPMIQPPIYTIPYRILLPQKIDGLLVAGRCVSATHEAISAIRVIPIAGTMGQAAGVASALAVKFNCSPKEIPIEELRSQLRLDGVLLEELI